MARIAFLGLGIMGSPMAANLVKAGHTVTGYNLTQPPIDALVAAGGRGTTGIAEAVAPPEKAITQGPAPPRGPEGLLGGGGGVAKSPRRVRPVTSNMINPPT